MRATAWAVGLVVWLGATASAAEFATVEKELPGHGTGVVEVEEIHIAPQPSAVVLGVVGGILVLLARRSMRRT